MIASSHAPQMMVGMTSSSTVHLRSAVLPPTSFSSSQHQSSSMLQSQQLPQTQLNATESLPKIVIPRKDPKVVQTSSASPQLLPQVPSSSGAISVASPGIAPGALIPAPSPGERPLSARTMASHTLDSIISANRSYAESRGMGKDFVTPGKSLPFGPKPKRKRRKNPLTQPPPGEESTHGSHTTSSSMYEDDDEPKFDVSMDLKKVSSEDFYLGMLGHKDLTCQPDDENPNLMLYREEFCNCCGVIHPNPSVLDVYGQCPHCFSELRASSSLRERMKNVKPKQPLEILFASYGDPEDLTTCRVVTEQCMERVALSRDRDRIAYTVKESIIDIFEGYCPGGPKKNKQLRMRYRVNLTAKGSGVIISQYGQLVLDFDPKGFIPQPFILLAQKAKFLRIAEAYYGHPKGASKTGRMSYEVTELIQSLIDQNGGSYLCISAMTPVMRLFGDPCPGYTKDLRITFEIVGRGGTVTYKEVRGNLIKRINIVSAPTVAPIIYVISATYGITPTARRDRLNLIAQELSKINYIEHRKREGMTVMPEEHLLCKRKGRLLELREIFQTAPTKFIDVTTKVQQIADRQKTSLILDKEKFDPNAVFGNPMIGYPKILEIYIDCQGHDSEKVTELNEMMDTGYTRNFITMKKGRFNLVVDDDMTTGKGKLMDSLNFVAEYCAPMIIVTKAMYGELDDLTKLIDVTSDVQSMVKGNTLIIEEDVNLNKVFKIDPSPGRQKKLQIKYITRGFTGNLRVREKNDLFVAGIELGYPPIPPPDDENHEMDH